MKVKAAQLFPTLQDPVDFTVLEILPGRILEWDLQDLPGIIPIQQSHPGLLHCGRIPYQLHHKGSLGILEWAA